MFNLGRGDKVIQVLPFPHLAERNIRTGFVEDREYDKIAAACTREGLWMRALFETGYRIGWRVSELQGLLVSQVDLLNRVVRLEPGQTKNGEGRTAPIEDRLYLWLQQCTVGKDPDRYVFSRDEDGIRPVADFRTRWYKVCCAAGLGEMLCKVCSTPIVKGKCPECHQDRTLKEQSYDGLIFHDLRRTTVRNMVRAGVPEKVAMTISGHLTRSVFDRYDIVSEADLREAALRMNARKMDNAQFDAQSDKAALPEVQSSKAAQNVRPN